MKFFLFISTWESASIISSKSAILEYDPKFEEKYELPEKRPYISKRVDMQEQSNEVKNIADQIFKYWNKGPINN